MPNANTHKVGRSAPMPQHVRFNGPVEEPAGLVYFNASRADQRDARIGSKPSKLAERMAYWESQGWSVRAETIK